MSQTPPRAVLWHAQTLRTAVVLLVGAAAACAPTGVRPEDPDAGPGGDGRTGPVAIDASWLQDRYAVMGRWYDYESVSHLITPRPYSWILAEGQGDAARYAAFRIVSYYDENTSEPGLITLALSTWNGASFDAEQEWTASANIKTTDEPLCVDVFARVEVDCTGTTWQLMLRMYKDMAPLSVIVIKDPGIFLRSWSGRPDLGDVRVARFDITDLSVLPAPSTIAALVEEPAADDWVTTDWDFGAFATNLPQNGMVLGDRFVDEGFVARDDTYFFANGRFTISKLTVKPQADGDVSAGLVFRVGGSALVREDFSIEEFPALRDVDVAMPAVGEIVYLSFEQEDLLAPAADTADSSWPFLPPDGSRWDLALERVDDDTARLIVSPAAAVWDSRPYLCDPTDPPPPDDLPPPVFVDVDDVTDTSCPE